MPRFFLGVALLLLPSILDAGDPAQPAARLRSPIGTLLQRGNTGWQTPMLYDAVPAGAELIALPGVRALLECQEGDVRLILAGNLPEFSSTPVLESVVELKHPSAGLDLEFVLKRGRVQMENHKETSAAKIRAHIQGKALDFELFDRKTIVALELFSRWPEGAPFLKKTRIDHQPIGELIFLVAKGKAVLQVSNGKHTLWGPSLYRFNTLGDVEGPLALKKVPDWFQPALDPPQQVKTLQTAVEKLRVIIADRGAAAGIAKAQDNPDVSLRQVAAYSGTGLDNPAAGLAALKDSQSKEVRAAGIHALRHYIGRGTVEDVKLYQTLLADKLMPGQASIVMELLHGFGPEARQRPEIYDALISYLQSDQLLVRELAAWNLARLVPQAKDVGYDAAATLEERRRSVVQWRQWIPEGQLPKTTK